MFDVQYASTLYLISNLFRIYTIYKFANLFLGKFKFSKKIQISAFFMYYVFNSFMFLYLSNNKVNLVINILVLFAITFLYDCVFQTKVLAALMIYAINMMIEGFFSELMLVFYKGNNFIFLALSISVILMFCFVLILEKLLNKNTQRMSMIHWMAIIIIPAISIFIAVVVIDSTISRITAVLVVTCLFMVNIIVFYLYDNLIVHYTAVYEKRILQEQNFAYLNQIEIMNESQKRLRMFKHDMKNHMSNMSALVKREKTEELLDYIKDTMEFIEVPGNFANSGNDCIDSILNMKLPEAKRLGTEITLSLKVPTMLQIEPFYLNMILSNLLDNAIEAIKPCDKKEINIEIELSKGIVYIDIANTYTGEIIQKENRFLTTKKDKDEHGLGLKNVELSVEKYGGSLDITRDANRFTASIMLFDKSIKELNL